VSPAEVAILKEAFDAYVGVKLDVGDAFADAILG
jgi:hypothetical protein